MNYDVMITTPTRVASQLEADLYHARRAMSYRVSSRRDACHIAVSMTARLVETRPRRHRAAIRMP